MNIALILKWIISHWKIASKVVYGLAVALLLSWGITLHKDNKKLSESLELAQNNIEAYQGSLQDSQQANNVLKLTVEDLQTYNDKLVQDLDSVRKKLKIKPKQLTAAATQTQILDVNDGKGVGGDLTTILKDTTYSDSIKYNDLTTVYYTIGKDTVNIGLDVRNTQYFYFFNERVYKNKKSFLKRLFTWDFKKVNKFKYDIQNTNDLLRTEDVRVIEIIK